MLSNEVVPYRVHLLNRVSDEIPEVELHSLFLESRPQLFPWQLGVGDVPHAVSFSPAHTTGPFRALKEWKRGSSAIKYLKEQGVSVVLVSGYSNLSLLRVINYAKRAGVPVFIKADSNVRGDAASSPIHKWLKERLVGWVVRSSTGVMPMGRLGIEYFEKYGASRSECYIVPYEPDYAFFAAKPDAEEIADFVSRHGLRGDRNRNRIIFSGRLVDVKRVDMLVTAFLSIAEARPNWDLLIAGDGVLRDSLRELVPLHLEDRILWLGFCGPADLRCAYHLSDVLALPSSKEPWGVVVSEAAAAGLVIVASDVVGAASEIVQDGVNGRIFRSGDVEALRSALAEVTDSTRLPLFKARVKPALGSWRERSDPVSGIREALHDVGVI